MVLAKFGEASTNPFDIVFKDKPFGGVINFEGQENAENNLILFVKMAQPLKYVLEEIGEIPKSLEIFIAEEGLSLQLPNIKESLFERLALRFRPFFANEESINFLRIINEIARHSPCFREEKELYKAQWMNAAFFNAMQVLQGKKVLDAENLITAAFYSSYFHFSEKELANADKFKNEYGDTAFRASYVSCVWKRAFLVVELSARIEQYLIESVLIPGNFSTLLREAYFHTPSSLFLTTR